MYILKNNNEIGKIILGNNTTIKSFSKNSSILESILKKNIEYFELTGDNTLYYNTGFDNYT